MIHIAFDVALDIGLDRKLKRTTKLRCDDYTECDVFTYVLLRAVITHRPPNSCMPSSEKMMMKRKMRSSNDTIDFMLLRSDRIRLRRDVQYLQTTHDTCYTAS